MRATTGLKWSRICVILWLAFPASFCCHLMSLLRSIGWPSAASCFGPGFSKSFSPWLSALHSATLPFLIQTSMLSGNVHRAALKRGKHPAWELPALWNSHQVACSICFLESAKGSGLCLLRCGEERRSGGESPGGSAEGTHRKGQKPWYRQNAQAVEKMQQQRRTGVMQNTKPFRKIWYSSWKEGAVKPGRKKDGTKLRGTIMFSN